MKTKMKLLLCLLMATLLFSCSPQKRIARIIKHNPGIVLKDTVTITDHDTIPEIKIVTEFKKDTSASVIDSSLTALFEKYKVDYPSVDLSAMKRSILMEMRSLYQSKKIFPTDTMVKVIDGITIKLFETAEGIGVTIHKPEQTKEEAHYAVVDSVTVMESNGIIENLKSKLFDPTFWLLLILLAVILLRKR